MYFRIFILLKNFSFLKFFYTIPVLFFIYFPVLAQIEIIVFLSSFGYIIYYAVDNFLDLYIRLRAKKREKQERIKQRIEKRSKAKTEVIQKKDIKKKDRHIDAEVSEKLREIIKRTQVNISRGYFDSARTLIIEGLALHKDNKDLNLLLADIYEQEKKYQNAEYIYRDLLDIYGEESYILQRLWNIYTLREKTEKSFECYMKALSYDKTNIEVLDILSHLALELKKYKKALKYSTMYLKEKPRTAEKLWIRGYCQEMLWKYSDAAKSYRAVLEIQPYNSEVQERLTSLEKNL